MTLEVGQVGLVVDNSPDFWPRVIRRVTHKQAGDMPIEQVPYHVVVADSEHSYIGAEPGGVVRREEGDPNYTKIAWSHFTDMGTNFSLRWLKDQLGVPYSYPDDAVVGLDDLLPGQFPRWVYGALINGDSWQCAALADMFLLLSGINVFEHRHPGNVTPANYAPVWIKNDWTWF